MNLLDKAALSNKKMYSFDSTIFTGTNKYRFDRDVTDDESSSDFIIDINDAVISSVME